MHDVVLKKYFQGIGSVVHQKVLQNFVNCPFGFATTIVFFKLIRKNSIELTATKCHGLRHKWAENITMIGDTK